MAGHTVERISIPSIGLGLDYRAEPVNIADGALADADGFWLEGMDVLSKRSGVKDVGTNLPLSGIPLRIDQFYKTNGISFLVCITTTNAYYYDEGTKLWVDITPAGGLHATADDGVSSDIINDIFVFSNGVDPVMQWDGLAAQASALANAPTGKIVRKFAERLFVLHLQNGPMTLQWSAPGDPTDWAGPGSGMVTLSEGVDWIQTAELLGPYLVIYRERSIVLCSYVGGTQLFRFDTIVPGIGPLAQNGVANLGTEHIFTGWDQIYSFQGGRTVEGIGDAIQQRLLGGQNPTDSRRSHVIVVEERNELWFAIPDVNSSLWPNVLWVFNYAYERWFRLSRTVTCLGFWQVEENVRIGDLTGTIGDMTARFGDRTFLSGSPLIVEGTPDGRVQTRDDSSNDDRGVPISAYVLTKEFNAGDISSMKRWLGIDVELLGGKCRVEYRIDGGPWRVARELQLSSGWKRYRVDFDATGRRMQLRFANDWAGPDGKLQIRGLEVKYMGRPAR